jgi:hypothetical protein
MAGNIQVDSHSSWSGLLYIWNETLAMDFTEAEQKAFSEQQCNKGDFHF